MFFKTTLLLQTIWRKQWRLWISQSLISLTQVYNSEA